MAFLIDTHIWIWWVSRNPKLPAKIIAVLDHTPDRPWLSVASLWELSNLVETGEIELAPSPRAWLEAATHPLTVELAQLTRAVALELLELPASLHRDPADRIIVATARALEVPLLTFDRRIRRSGLVELWTA
ncbi:MAG: type II toxin-antitoxin system VapC family toxin [Chthoniobacterales bacterium]|nr:type II toxin-antitoxin system VapC family toxin [Chthoniobacterales bacterium]